MFELIQGGVKSEILGGEMKKCCGRADLGED